MGSDPQPMHVIIVGAGLGGSACAIACARQGMKVTLLDQVKEFQPLGDSIGFGPNTAKLFKRWEMYDDLRAVSSHARNCIMHSYEGAVLTIDNSLSKDVEEFGHRAVIGHRGKLHMIFLDHCRKNGVDVRQGSAVKDYDVNKPSVFLENGDEIVGDVVIGADGVKSKGREKVLGYFDAPVHSGYAIYRAFMPSDIYKNDPLTLPYLRDPNGDCFHLYVGPDMHAIVTTVERGAQMNLVLTHKDVADISEGWSVPGKKSDVLALLKGCDPALIRAWELMDEKKILDWKLVYRPCLDKWVTDSGLVAIMGDAAHPFLPTSAQGASQAIEDGATIAQCLAKAGKGNVPVALHTYFEIRHDYAKKAQQTGVSTRNRFHNMHSQDGQLKEDFDPNQRVLDSHHLQSNDSEQQVHDKWDAVSQQVAARLQKASISS